MEALTMLTRVAKSAAAVAVASGLAITGCAARLHNASPAAHVTPLKIEAAGVERVEQRAGSSQRLFDVAGGSGISAGSVTVTPRTATPLARDLQVSFDRCSVRWAADANGNDYTCAGVVTVLAEAQPAHGTIDLHDFNVAAGSVAYVRARVMAPAGAAPGQSATLDYDFVVTS